MIEDPASYWFMGNEDTIREEILSDSLWTPEKIEEWRKKFEDNLGVNTVVQDALKSAVREIPNEDPDNDESSEESEDISDTDSMPSLISNLDSDDDDDDMPDLIDVSPLPSSGAMAMSSNVEQSSASQSDSDSCQDEEMVTYSDTAASQEYLMSGKLESLLSILRCCIINSRSG